MSSAWGLQDIVSAACGPVVKLWSAQQPQDRTLKFNEGTDVHSLAFSHNNKVLAVAGDGGRVQLYSGSRDGAITNVGQLPADRGELLPARVTAVRFAPNDGHLVGGCEDGTLHIWSLRAEVRGGWVDMVCRGMLWHAVGGPRQLPPTTTPRT